MRFVGDVEDAIMFGIAFIKFYCQGYTGDGYILFRAVRHDSVGILGCVEAFFEGFFAFDSKFGEYIDAHYSLTGYRCVVSGIGGSDGVNTGGIELGAEFFIFTKNQRISFFTLVNGVFNQRVVNACYTSTRTIERITCSDVDNVINEREGRLNLVAAAFKFYGDCSGLDAIFGGGEGVDSFLNRCGIGEFGCLAVTDAYSNTAISRIIREGPSVSISEGYRLDF